jgi:HEAT repeat protein
VLAQGTEEQTSRRLLRILKDATDIPGVRWNSAIALANVFFKRNEIVSALLDAVSDPAIRDASLEALFLILETGRMPEIT